MQIFQEKKYIFGIFLAFVYNYYNRIFEKRFVKSRVLIKNVQCKFIYD